MDGLRSTQEQLQDEFLSTYKRMTDPEERKKARIKERRKQFTSDMQTDAGL